MNIQRRSIICTTIIIMIIVIITLGFKKNTTIHLIQQDIPEMPKQEYTSIDIENLTLLCKVWGFMKYYHPAVRSGKYDWDRELLCIMPSLVSISSKEKRNKILTKWIDKFAILIKPEKNILPTPDSVKLYPDINWIDNTDALGITLSDRLKEIRNAERHTLSYYVRLNKGDMGDENAVFTHEKNYSECAFPNISYQLLSLFRLWNAIQYYYPYKYLLKENWNETLLNHIPSFLSTKNKTDYENALKMFIAKINDSHACIYGCETKKFLAPVIAQFIEGKPAVIDYYEIKSGYRDSIEHILQSGDILLRINSESIDSIIKRTAPYISASNTASLLRDIAVRDLLWSNEPLLYVNYERDGIMQKTKIKCLPVDQINNFTIFQKKQPLITTLPTNILHIYMGSSIGGEVPQKIEAKGVILDLRGYPTSNKIKGYWDYEVLYPTSIDFVVPTRGSLLHPGLFTFGHIMKAGKENKNFYQGKKVILVNELTQSHAEFMAMKYRCVPNTIVMGSMTAGTDGNISSIPLPGNLTATFTGLGIYYPNKSETQQIGIVPDIEVKNTIQGIRDGRDEVLEAAINYLNN